MQSILDKLAEWLKELLISGILGNLSGMFDTVNTKVGEIAGEVGMTPSAWNGGVFNLIRSLSETVIIPIAGIILTFVMCYELIQLVIEKNNLHDVDTWIFFKWIFKTFVAVFLVTNTWNIVMAIFDVAQNVVSQSGGIISGSTSIDLSTAIPDMEAQLEAMDLGPLLGLWFQSMVVGLTMNILSICIFLVVYGRMIEIYLVTSVGPIPFATMSNREWSSVGQNYLKSLIALGFQAFLIMICVGIYAVLIQEISTADNISAAIWGCMGYTVLLCFTPAVLLGVPLFFLLKESAGNSTATLCMMMVMLPFFLLAMYEKNGQPLEVILKQMIETKFIRPKNRPYQTNNFYEALARQRDLEMEVKRIVQNRKNGGKGKTHRQREKGRG